MSADAPSRKLLREAPEIFKRVRRHSSLEGDAGFL